MLIKRREFLVQKLMLKKQAVKEFVSVIAETTLLLADEASSTITGSTFALDGGWST